MRNFLVMLALGLGVAFTANAQKGKKDKGEDFTPEQKTELMVKKMTLELDLTDSQVNQVKPLIKERVLAREAKRKEREAMKASGEKPTKSKDEKFEKANEKLDKKIEFKNKMKQILTPEQMEKFEKMKKKKGKKGKKGGESCEKSCEGKK